MRRDGGAGPTRQGTITSASFNLLSSMVGGGSLSLPLAFLQAGNLFMAPVILVITNILAQRSIYLLVKAGVYSSPNSNSDGYHLISKKGNAKYEGMAFEAFGSKARVFSMVLVCTCCECPPLCVSREVSFQEPIQLMHDHRNHAGFFATIGYAVLLRDMLEPIIDAVVPPPEGAGGGPTLARNGAMILVVLCITPLTTWKNLTALKNIGMASMAAVLTVGMCVAYRSIECVFSDSDEPMEHYKNVQAFPNSAKDLLDSIPLFISSFICHFNVLPIHNELRCPSSDRVRQWVRKSLWSATAFYYFIGFTGSLHAKCTPTGSVSGNVLLDFEEDDLLLLVGRLCLAMTITCAFPMLVVPSRDIILGTRLGRYLSMKQGNLGNEALRHHDSDPENEPAIPIDISVPHDGLTTIDFEPMEIRQPSRGGDTLDEPLLALEDSYRRNISEEFDDNFAESLSTSTRQTQAAASDSTVARTVIALLVFWSAVALACMVKSIDVVWDLLGSSFSIMLAFLLPSGCYLRLSRRFSSQHRDGGHGFRRWMLSRMVAWGMILLFVPLMFLSTANACYNLYASNSA